MAPKMIKSSRNNISFPHTRMIMQVSLIISLFFHIILLLAFKKAFPLNWAVKEFRTYRVELIRPPVENIKADEIFESDVARIKQEQRPVPKEDQDTISLDTEDKRYVTYARIVKERITQHWRYPQEARENLIEGRLMVIFSLAREGNMTQIKIIKTSGYTILDEEAVRAIGLAAPFPPFPEHITVSRLNIKAAFDYQFTTRK